LIPSTLDLKFGWKFVGPVEGFAEPENFINKNEDFLRTKQYFAARNSASMKLCRIGRLCLTAGAAAYNEAAALLMVSL
jgi:hypothetical protein